jgi:hypothetical protein
MSQNNPLVLVGFYQNLHHHAPKITHLFWLDFIKTYTIMHQKQSSQYVIGSMEKSFNK